MYQQEGAMAKISRARKTAVKTRKKRERIKTITPSRSSKKKTSIKKLASEKTTKKSERQKTPIKARRSAVKIREEKDEKSKAKLLKQKPVTRKTARKKPAKKKLAAVTGRPSTTTEIRSKTEKHPKPTKIEAEVKRSRAKKTEPPKREAKPATRKPRKKVSSVKKGKPFVSEKLPEASERGGRPRKEKKEPLLLKAPEKIEHIISEKPPRPAKKPAARKKPSIRHAPKDESPKKPREAQESLEVTEPEVRRIVSEERRPIIPIAPERMEDLPSEYGENSITLMTVNPYRIFSFWEVRKETLDIFRGILNIRLYDVTGIDFPANESHSFFDVVIWERIGKMYLDVSPSREYVADIGILYDGIFIGIARSQKVSTPNAAVPGEEVFLPKTFDIGIRMGY